jgi:ActR/RegA family two-component response regulator
MSGEPDLAGQSILVLEDDFTQACEMERTLSSAGARVVGPFSREGYAIEAIRIGRMSAAVIGVNPRPGLSFAAARALQRANVPFLFLMGCEQSSIPANFGPIPRIAKPTNADKIVRMLAHLLTENRDRTP